MLQDFVHHPVWLWLWYLEVVLLRFCVILPVRRFCCKIVVYFNGNQTTCEASYPGLAAMWVGPTEIILLKCWKTSQPWTDFAGLCFKLKTCLQIGRLNLYIINLDARKNNLFFSGRFTKKCRVACLWRITRHVSQLGSEKNSWDLEWLKQRHRSFFMIQRFLGCDTNVGFCTNRSPLDLKWSEGPAANFWMAKKDKISWCLWGCLSG